MSDLQLLNIDLLGLKEGETVLEYELNDTYFQSLESAEVRRGRVHVTLNIRKVVAYFEMKFHIMGQVIVPCDLCLDDMEQLVMAENRLIVRLGEAYNEDDDEVTVNESEGMLDVSWFIYEFIALAIPIKRMHAPGECNPAMMKVLEEHSTDQSRNGDATGEIDPRWAKLKDIKL